MSDLVRNPEDRFSHNEAQIVNEGASVSEDGSDYDIAYGAQFS